MEGARRLHAWGNRRFACGSARKGDTLPAPLFGCGRRDGQRASHGDGEENAKRRGARRSAVLAVQIEFIHLVGVCVNRESLGVSRCSRRSASGVRRLQEVHEALGIVTGGEGIQKLEHGRHLLAAEPDEENVGGESSMFSILPPHVSIYDLQIEIEHGTKLGQMRKLFVCCSLMFSISLVVIHLVLVSKLQQWSPIQRAQKNEKLHRLGSEAGRWNLVS